MYVNGKMRPVETAPGMGDGELKENDGEDKFNYHIFDILSEFFLNSTMCPHGGTLHFLGNWHFL
jgi:hypothetical protein